MKIIKSTIMVMAVALLVIVLTACGGDNKKKGIPAIQEVYDMMDKYWYQREDTPEGIRKARDITSKYVKDNSNHLTFDVETDETTPVKTSDFKFSYCYIPSVSFTGKIHLETKKDLGPIHLISYESIPELSFVFYHDDLPLLVRYVGYTPTSGQELVLDVYGNLEFPHQYNLPELRYINRVVLTKKKIDAKDVRIGREAFKLRQLITEGSILFDKGVLGPVQVGKPISDLPKAVEGLYDHYKHKVIEHEGDDMDGPWTEDSYLFTKGGKDIFCANISDGKVFSISLQEGSSFIKTPDGIYVGYSARELFKKIRMEWTNYYDGNCFGSSNHFYYYVNSDDLIRTDIPNKAEDFKEDAKVISIAYINDNP